MLVNSNPATIMTDPELADATYIEPITPEIVERIIARERAEGHPIGALLPTMGGQTALNTAMALSRSGVLARYGVELIGANEEAIAKAEDRQLFRQAMDQIGLESPKSRLVDSLDAARGGARRCRAAGDHPAVLHAGRHRRRHRLQHRGIRGDRSAAACAPRRRMRCWSRNRCSAGRNTSSKSSATAPTTASSSARSRISIRWGCIPAIR